MSNDSINAVQELVAVLEAGTYNTSPSRLMSGKPLVVEDLAPVMQVITFLDIPTREVNGRRQPILEIYGRAYEFWYVGNGCWEQVPSNFTAQNPTIPNWFGKGWRKISRKRLTPYQVRKAGRRLNKYLKYFLKE